MMDLPVVVRDWLLATTFLGVSTVLSYGLLGYTFPAQQTIAQFCCQLITHIFLDTVTFCFSLHFILLIIMA
jgi:hypothetical protein